ncbi:DUF4932 domain-containing protein [Aquimarina macrocephali]|uniref:DUF4932 domain-containing protein n=1 Tax=Aquimarina macrocephali TaxID=666563 RepID=UPI003F6706F9
MKKTPFLINVFLLIIVFACKEKTAVRNLEPESENKNKVIFKIDERTEFFRTIFNIATQDVLSEDIKPCNTQYLKRVNKHFLPYKNHPLIKWIYDDENIGIDFSTIGLMYKGLEKFELGINYEKELEHLGLNKKTLDSVKPLMIDFYKKSEFNKFFKNNKEYYSQTISKIEKQVLDEKLFDKIMSFYQDNQKGLELIVFVELTNNANNKAVDFYDNYNLKKRAIILANICDMPNETTKANDILELNNDIRGTLYHETSHLFTTKLLDQYIGDLNQYRTICEDCKQIEIIDKVDHMVVRPLQALMMERFDKNNQGNDFFLNKCTDVRKQVYHRLTEYQPEDKIPFEKTYIDCINLIKASASK